MHCGSKVIRTGDSAEKVREYCGEPSNIERRIIYRQPFVTSSSGLHIGRATVTDGTDSIGRGASEEVWVETWTYDFGRSKLVRTIRLDDGIVISIATGGYGE